MRENSYTLEQISEIVNGIINTQEKNLKIDKILPPDLCDETSLALAFGEEEIAKLAKTKAKAAILPFGVGLEAISTIEVERPRLAMMKLAHLFYEAPDAPVGVHPTAVVHPEAILGENVSIGAYTVICRGAKIGNNTKILPNCYIGKGTQIGDNCFFHAGVNIGDFIKIGSKVIINHGASVGADGYSFVTETPSNVEQAKESGNVEGQAKQVIHKIPSLGSVEIGNDVEIGANATIDRGTIENTIVGDGTKIDNLVMISHNCRVGENCMIISQVGIAGSTVIGDRVVLAGQVGVVDHINIAPDSIVMAKSGVTKNIEKKSILMGMPAVPRKQFVKNQKAIKDVAKLAQELKELRTQIEEMKKNG